MKKVQRLAGLALALIAGPIVSHAGVIVTDQFTMSTGNLEGGGGGVGFAAAWDDTATPPEITVDASSLTSDAYTSRGLSPDGNKVKSPVGPGGTANDDFFASRQLSTAINMNSDNTYYFSFLVYGTWTTLSNSRGFNVGFSPSATALSGGSVTIKKDYNTENLYYAIDGTHFTPGLSSGIVGNSVRFVVGKIVASSTVSDQVKFKVYAPTASVPTIEEWDIQNTTLQSASLRYLVIAGRVNDSGMYYNFDEVRIGQTWDDVVKYRREWTGATDGAWVTANNWDGGASIPGDNVYLTFPDVVNQTVTPGSPRTVGNMTFNAADAYELVVGQPLNIDSSGLTIAQNGAGSVAINAGLYWYAYGITLAGSGTGAVSLRKLLGTSTINVSAGSWTLTYDNSAFLTAGTKWNLVGGILSADKANELGYAPSSLVSDYLTLNGGTLKASAAVTLDANRGITIGALDGTFDVDASQTLTINSVIAGASGCDLSKTGAGTLTLSGANTYNGATAVNGGTLLVNNTSDSGTGSGAVTINNGGTLGGSGSISGTVTVKDGGDLAPGASIGTLNVGNLSLEANSTFVCEIASLSSFDTVAVSSTLTLPRYGKTYIEIPSGSSLAPNTSYDVISYSWMSGGSTENIEAFNGADSLGVSVTLTGTKVRVTTTPEPGVLGCAALLLLGLRTGTRADTAS